MKQHTQVDLAPVLSIEPSGVSQSFFAGVGVPMCFAQLNSNEAVDRATITRAAWTATLSRAWSPHLFFFAGDLRDGGRLYARMWAHIERYSNIAHLWSSYALYSDGQQGARGINCIQAIKEAGGWRVTGIMVQAESAAAPLPKQYLR